MSRIVPVLSVDDLVKAQLGATRGPKVGHKYKRRVRVFRQGKLSWRYYYEDSDPKRMREFLGQAAKEMRAQRKKVKKLLPEGAPEAAHDSAFKTDNPQLRDARKMLREMSAEYVTAILAWKKPPEIEITETIHKEYHQALVELYGDHEPDTLLNQPHSPLRALEVAFEIMPPSIKETFSGAISEIMFGTAGETKLGRYSGMAIPGPEGTKIVVDAAKSMRPPKKGAHMKGGLWPIEVLVHEMGHAIHNELGGAPLHPRMNKQWKRSSFKDYERWHHRKGKNETPITGYAATNIREHWAESFTAALMFPRELAACSEETYNWWRGFFGPEVMRPIRTDKEAIRRLDAKRKAAVQAGDREKAAKLAAEIDLLYGVLDMPKDDSRLQWWTGRKSHVQQQLEKAERGTYGSVGTEHKSDRFYEISHNGRTIYFRYGPDGKQSFSGWEPGKHGAASKKAPLGFTRLIPRTSEIKEIYTAEGKPLTNDTAWWYLMQDDPDYQDGGKESDELISFTETSAAQKKVRDRNSFNKLMGYNAHGVGVKHTKGQAVPEAHAKLMPAEITRDEFRQRSGTFVFDNWEIAGQADLEIMKRTKYGSGEWEAAFARLRDVQPHIKFSTQEDKRGRVVGRLYRRGIELIQDQITGGWIPDFHKVNYVNDNPDGSRTIIACTRNDDGRYYVSDTAWRKLLTPFGEDINGAADLTLKCQQAAEAQFGGPPDYMAQPRRTWISVRTDTKRGDTAHYYHLEVEFDGRGSPRILGDRWKQVLGKDEPRLEDLLAPATLREAQAGETQRAQIKAERIKLNKPRKRNKRLPPAPGERIILTIRPAEVKAGKREEKDVIARLVRAIPGKKAGEVPSPPGWDRMPEGIAEALLPAGPLEKKASRLTKREKELKHGTKKRSALLPDWYVGTPSQRKWLVDVFELAYKDWDRTKEELTAKELPPTYILVGEAAGGAGGQTFKRYGVDDVRATTRVAITEVIPKPLDHDILCYAHTEVDAATGRPIETSLQLILPKDGSFPIESVEDLPGVEVTRTPLTKEQRALGMVGEVEAIIVNTTGFHRIRDMLGGLSLTSGAEQLLRQAVDGLRQTAEEAARGAHIIDMEDVDPELLEAMGVGVNGTLPGGAKFELPYHQRKLIQRLLDNDGRLLAAHFMGTGKTVSAIVVAKLMIALRKNPKLAAKYKVNPEDFPSKVIVVAPLNTVEQWREACFFFDEGCQVVGSGRDHMSVDTYLASGDESELVIVGPEYWTQNQKKLKEAGFDGLVLDEAHRGLKNEKTARNRALKEWNADMKTLFLMTGTPETIGPQDWVEYVKLLSQGKIWGGMSENQFVNEFTDESSIPGELGSARRGPKTDIRPSHRREFAGVVGSLTDVALPKDVRGKTLPAVRIEETEHAHMMGMQALLYALKMAALSDADVNQLRSNSALAADELAGLSQDARRQVLAAKQIANNPAMKPASQDEFTTYTKHTPTKEQRVSKSKEPFQTFDPKWLMERKDIENKKFRKKFAGKWPRIEEIGQEQAILYDLHLQEVLGAAYAELEGTKITPKQLARLKKDGWPKNLKNPDWGPLGIRCRGRTDLPTGAAKARAVKAQELQRLYAAALQIKIEVPDAKGKLRAQTPDPDTALAAAASQLGISLEEAIKLKGVRPDFGDHSNTVTKNGVTATTEDWWVSDKRSSLHLLHHPDDVDEQGRPLARGGFKTVKDGDIVKAKMPLSKFVPKGMKASEWVAPPFRYDASLVGKGRNTGKVAVVAMGSGDPEGTGIRNGDVFWVAPKNVTAQAKSLMDPGYRADASGRKTSLREERAKADVAMTVGNAKAEELEAHITRFHVHTGRGSFAPGEHGARQMVMFANGILDGCRTMEATLRTMGFRDVNEVIEGSPHHDPEYDKGPAPNGKYFVTYIGSTYTGNRELNIEIFKKVKDKLDRDTAVSMFVHKTMEGRPWRAYPSASPHGNIQRSRWTQDQRDAIYKAFRVRAPEAIYRDKRGRKLYFYGTRESAKILEQMKDLPDPAQVVDADRAEAIRGQLHSLQQKYEQFVQKGLTKKGPDGKEITRGEAPLTKKQQTVYNNCEMIVCSDAAQVGMNLGNAVEMVQYDSLGSPQAEWQRITRSARMLPPAVKRSLTDPRIRRVQGLTGSKFKYMRDIETDQIKERKRGAEVQVSYIDAKGNPKKRWVSRSVITELASPVEKLKKMEAHLFKAGPRGQTGGQVNDFKIYGKKVTAASTLTDALTELSLHAQEQAATTTDKAQGQQWEAIAAQARIGASLGVLQAVETLHNLSETKAPGTTSNMISFSDPIDYHDPREGTYAGGEIVAPAEGSLREAMDRVLTEEEREMFAKAGFTRGDESGSYDPVAVYMAIRAEEILTYIADQRKQVEGRLRATSAGAIVTESDVINTIIDSLTPNDRAILKSKKYLVNVRRLGVSAAMPQHIERTTLDPETGNKITQRVFTGYEKEHPVSTDRNVRAMGRARQRPYEERMADIQAGLVPDVPLDYETVDARTVADTSRLDIVKAVRLVFDLEKVVMEDPYER